MMSHGKFYGSTAMGERGQVVIPAEAREELKIEPGEKLLVFGNARKGTVILIKSDIMTKFADILFKKSKLVEELFSRGEKNERDD